MPGRLRDAWRCAVVWLAIGCASAGREPPAGPIDFRDATIRRELTRAAEGLLAQPEHQGVIQTDAATLAALPPPLVLLHRLLASHGVKRAIVDTTDSTVTLVATRGRTQYLYRYSRRPLPAPYSGPAVLTMRNFLDWRELRRIATVGPDTSACRLARFVFEPMVVHPYLARTLGTAFLDTLAADSGLGAPSPTEREAVLLALGRQREAGSGLLGHPLITYDSAAGELTLGSSRVGRAFWAVRLLDQLLASGAVQLARDRSHLALRPALSPEDRNRVAWLQLGMMDFLYGNLLEVPDPGYAAALGGGWYLWIS